MPRDFLTFPMKEDRVRQYVGRGRIFWLLIDGCLSIFHFRRQASNNTLLDAHLRYAGERFGFDAAATEWKADDVKV